MAIEGWGGGASEGSGVLASLPGVHACCRAQWGCVLTCVGYVCDVCVCLLD